MTYAEKLKDPRWQKRRLEIMERDGFTCHDCEAKESELHVHHLVYRKGKEPWESHEDDLVTLCKDCHKKLTESHKAIEEALAKFPVGSTEHLAEILTTVSRMSLADLVTWTLMVSRGVFRTPKTPELITAEINLWCMMVDHRNKERESSSENPIHQA